MSAVIIDENSRPALVRGVKLHFDETRDQWILNAPERVLVLDEIAQTVIARIDGKLSINELCWQLAVDFAAPQDIIQADVMEMLQEMLARGYIRI